MLLHLRPRLFCSFKDVSVVDIAIPSLNLYLQGDADITARRPYPNKQYAVACRKKGRKAVDGLLIATAEPLTQFECVTRWAIEATAVVTHRVQYMLSDQEFDAASDDMVLWYACNEDRNWSNRWPPDKERLAPVRLEPVMELTGRSIGRRANTRDTFDQALGWITLRRQTFEMPTIERNRLLGDTWHNRVPKIGDAFEVRIRCTNCRPASLKRCRIFANKRCKSNR